MGVPDYTTEGVNAILAHVRATWTPQLPKALKVEQFELFPNCYIVIAALTDGRRFTYYAFDVGSNPKITQGGKFSDEQ